MAASTFCFPFGGNSIALRTTALPRVYITDSQFWEVRGGWGASNGSGGGAEAGGARPQTAEIVKTFNERCPDLTVTNNKDKANFAVILDHEGGKGLLASQE